MDTAKHAPERRIRAGLITILWLWLAEALVSALLALANTYSTTQVMERNFEHALSGLMPAIWITLESLSILAAIGIGVGLFKIAGAPLRWCC